MKSLSIYLKMIYLSAVCMGVFGVFAMQSHAQEVNEYHDTLRLCRSDLPVTYDTIQITNAGDYIIPMSTALGTDSIVNLHVVVYENPVPHITGETGHCADMWSLVQVEDVFAHIVWSTGAETYYTASNDSSCSVMVTDEHGCEGSANIVFEIYPIPEIQISGNTMLCYGDSTTYTASGVAFYNWKDRMGRTLSNSESVDYIANEAISYQDSLLLYGYSTQGCVNRSYLHIQVFPPFETVDTVTICRSELPYQRGVFSFADAGTYPIHYQSQHGCDSLEMLTVVIKENPQVYIVGADSICEGKTTVLTASGATNYLWSTQSTAESIVAYPNQLYWLIGMANNGCASTDTLFMRSLPLPVISIEGPTEVCNGQSVTLSATAGYSYHWNTGESSANITVSPTENTEYQVIAINQYACYSTASISVMVFPTFETNMSVTVCSNDLPYVYYNQSFSEAGNYEVHLTSVHGCDSLVHLNLTVNESPYALINGTTEICPGASTQLSANGNGTFRWNTGANRSPITVTTPGWYVLTVTAANGCNAYDSVEVVYLPLPEVTISGDSAVCRGSEAVLTASGAYSYSWNTGIYGSVLTVSPQQTSTYVVTGTSDRNCTATATRQVRVNPVPTANIVGADEICQGDSSVWVATGGQHYQWSTGDTNAYLKVTMEQLYTVEVTNQYGCSASASKYLEVNSLPTVSILGANSFCTGGNAVLTATAMNAESFVWNNTTLGQTYNVTAPGVYTVKATSSDGCSSTASITVSQLPLPEIVVTGELSFCEGQSTQLTATGGASYIWRNAYGVQVGNSSTITLTEGGVYSVTATSSEGCSATQQLSVTKKTLPTVTIVPSADEVCEGTPVSLSAGYASGYTYLWNTGATSRQIEVNNSGFYVLQVSANGCTAIDSIEIIVHGLPVITFSGDSVINAGESTTIYASAPQVISYHWNTGSNSNSITVTPDFTTTYTVEVENVYACRNQESIRVIVNHAPVISGDDYICVGDSALWQVTGGVSYLWNDGVTSAERYITTAGTYTVVATNEEGYTVSASKTMSYYDIPVANIQGNQLICQGDTVTLTASLSNMPQANVSYQWNTGAATSVLKLTPMVNSTYQVIATDEHGCTATASIDVTVNPSYDTTIQVSCCSNDLPFVIHNQEFNQSGNYTINLTSVQGCDSIVHINLTVNDSPYAIISGNTEICAGASTSLTANGNGTFRWNTGAVRSPITVNTAGWYVLTVTAPNGCTSSDSVEVSVFPLPVITIEGVDSICRGSELVLQASGAASYRWNTGVDGSTLTLTPTQTATYTVTGTSEQGCSASSSRRVVVNAVPMANISGVDAICQGDTTVFTAIGGSYFLWNTGDTTASVSVSNEAMYSVVVSNNYGCTATASKYLEVNSIPNVTIIGQPYFCEGGNTTLNALGSNAISYVWNNIGIGQTYMVSTPGEYTVMATSMSNCTATASVTVVQYSLPEITVTGALTFCDGSSTQLSASGGQSYIWRNTYGSQIANTETVTLTEGGVYSVMATDSNACTSVQQVIIQKKNLPNVSIIASNNDVCEGTTITLMAGWSSGYTYLWSTGATDRQISINQPGTYVLQVTANGCTATDSTTINMYSLPVISFSGDTIICRGNMANIYAYAPNAVSYSWENPAVTNNHITVIPNESTAYIVNVTDINGCSSRDSVNVVVEVSPTAAITGSNYICEGGIATLIATGGVYYLWDDGTTTPERTINDVGTYSVQVFTAAGCVATAQKTILDYGGPEILINGPDHICSGDSVVLTAQGGVQYIWSNLSTDSSITISETGIYMVEGWDANGCSSRDTIEMGVLPVPVVQITGNARACSDNINMLTAQCNSAVSYLWNTGSTASQVRTTGSGVYSVVVTDSNACHATASFNFEMLPQPECSILGNTRICLGDTTTLTASNGVHFFWNTMSTSRSIQVSPAATTTYTLVILDANGCAANTTAQVIVQPYTQATITGSDYFCEGDSVLLVASFQEGGMIWSNGHIGDSIFVYESGDYSVSANDSAACIYPATKHVERNLNPEVQIEGAAQACMGDTTNLYAHANQEVTYQWSTGSIDSIIHVTSTNVYTVNVTSTFGCTNSASKLVMVYAAPTVSINGPSSACNGAETVLTATGNATQYVWSTGDSTASISIRPRYSNTYGVTAYNNYGCSATAAHPMTVMPLPVATISGDTLLCQGEVGVLTSSNASSFHWSTGANTRSINVSATGDYTVVVSNSSGCTNSASIHVQVNEVPNLVIMGDSVICQGEQVILMAHGGESYLWNDGSDSQFMVAMPSTTTSYTVQAFNGQCSSMATRTVTVHERPQAAILAPDGICDGSTVTLTAQGGLVYVWSTGQTSAMINVNTNGLYQLIAFDQNGCSDTTTHNLQLYPQPTVQITGPSALCQGEEGVLSASGTGNFLWSQGDTTANITISMPGNYQVQITNVQGCTATANHYVSQLLTPTVMIDGPSNICGAETVTLNAVCTNAATYSWNTGASSQSIEVSPTETTTYTVVVTSTDQCTAEQSITIGVHQSYSSSFYAEICQGQAYYGQGFSIPVQTEGGEFVYADSMQTIYGCDSVRVLYLTVKTPPIITNEITGNGSITAPGNYVYMIDPVENATHYEWILSNPNWTLTFNQNIAQVTIMTPGMATLSLYALNECGQSIPASKQIVYGTGVDNIDASEVNVYPNPTQGKVHIQWLSENIQNIDIQLFDIYGKQLGSWTMTGDNTEIDLSEFTSGVYMLKLRNRQNFSERVLKIVRD